MLHSLEPNTKESLPHFTLHVKKKPVVLTSMLVGPDVEIGLYARGKNVYQNIVIHRI
jgi:hypothetical protein